MAQYQRYLHLQFHKNNYYLQLKQNRGNSDERICFMALKGWTIVAEVKLVCGHKQPVDSWDILIQNTPGQVLPQPHWKSCGDCRSRLN